MRSHIGNTGRAAMTALVLLVACARPNAGDPSAPADERIGTSREALTVQQLTTCTAADQQVAPDLSGNLVVWTEGLTEPATATESAFTNFDIDTYDLSTGAPPVDTTNTPNTQEFLADVDGSTVVYILTAENIDGNIVACDLAAGTCFTVASSSQDVFFSAPALGGGGSFIVFTRLVGASSNVIGYDNVLGLPYDITFGSTTQTNFPRTDGNFVVYEDSTSGTSKISAWSVATKGPTFDLTSGAVGTDATWPDVDNGTVVYSQTVAGVDQIFAYDLASQTATQLTTAPGEKTQTRISGNVVVWADKRNGVDLDVYGYDLTTGTELTIATGPEDQDLPNVDGNRVVYQDNSSGCEQVSLVTLASSVHSTLTIGPPHVGSFVTSASLFQLAAPGASSVSYRWFSQGTTPPAFTVVTGASATFTLTGTDGPYEVDTFATDSSGVSETPTPTFVTLDNGGPVITINSPTNGVVSIDANIVVSYFITEVAGPGVVSATATLDGTPVTNLQDIPAIGLSTGTIHLFVVTAVDALGNTTTASTSFEIVVTESGISNEVKTFAAEGDVNPPLVTPIEDLLGAAAAAPSCIERDAIYAATIVTIDVESGRGISPATAKTLVSLLRTLIVPCR